MWTVSRQFQQSGIHFLIICAIQLLTPNSLGELLWCLWDWYVSSSCFIDAFLVVPSGDDDDDDDDDVWVVGWFIDASLVAPSGDDDDET